MNRKKLNKIFILAAAGTLVVLSVLAAVRARRIQDGEPVVVEQAVADIVDIRAVEVTPEPTATPETPAGAVTLYVDLRPVLTLESEIEMQKLLWTYLMDSAVAPEGERLLSARFAGELIISPAQPGADVGTYDEAYALLMNAPTIVPIWMTTQRTEDYQDGDETIQSSVSENGALFSGSRIIVQLGSLAVKKQISQITYLGGAQSDAGSPEIKVIHEARGTIIANGAYAKRDASGQPRKQEGPEGKDAGELELRYPMRGRVSSYFGWREGKAHNGLDITNSAGTQVLAPAEGVVRYCGERGAYGFVVDIDHGNGFLSRLTHLSDVVVELNQRVFSEEKIGVLAETEDGEGRPHLHYELIIDGVPYDPTHYLS